MVKRRHVCLWGRLDLFSVSVRNLDSRYLHELENCISFIYLFRFEMERSFLANLPDLVLDNILLYLTEQDLYRVSIIFPEIMLNYPAIEWIVNEFKSENPGECLICNCRFPTATFLGVHYALAHPVPIEEQLRRFFSLEG